MSQRCLGFLSMDECAQSQVMWLRDVYVLDALPDERECIREAIEVRIAAGRNEDVWGTGVH